MRKFLCFIVVIFTNTVYAQKSGLGKVTKDELLEIKHKTDTAASAAFIFKKAKTDFVYTEKNGFTSTTVFYVKLKIYKKEGLEWANFRIPYYIGYKNLEDEYVDIISGYTYNLEKDKVIKSKVTGEGKFKEQLNENWEVKSVTFPNVKVGSVIELEYRFKSQNLDELPEFQYQYDIPVDYAEYKTNIPEFFIYKGIKKGRIELGMNQQIESTSQSYQGSVGRASENRSFSYNQIVTYYAVSEVPALIEEDYVNNINNYYGKVEHELQTIRYPGETPKQIASTWEDVAKSIYGNKAFAEATTRFDYFANDIKPMIKDLATTEEKVQKIFNYVKKIMSWNGTNGYYPTKAMPAVYSERTGNVAEINLMLISMLRISGIEANPVLVSTRNNGLAYFPNRSLFNYVIAAVSYDDKMVLLDATNKFSDFNILPIRVLNDVGRLIKKNGETSEVKLMPKFNSEKGSTILATIENNGEVTGKIRESYLNYHALLYKDRHAGINKESYVEKLESKYEGFEVNDFELENSDDFSKAIVESYNFKSTNSVEIIGDKMYFSPTLFLAQTENPFKQDNREYPVDFMFPTKNKINININLPTGYTIESLPQSKAVSMAKNIGNFKYNISGADNKIQLLFTFDINQAVILPEDYDVLKNFYKEMINKQTEKIVLKKV